MQHLSIARDRINLENSFFHGKNKNNQVFKEIDIYRSSPKGAEEMQIEGLDLFRAFRGQTAVFRIN